MCWAAAIPFALSAGQGLIQGLNAKKQANAQANELQQNAFYLNQAANDALARGRIESDNARIQTQQLIGTQRAAQAANGGEVNTGSNALLQQDVAQFGELDALTISNNAAREAYGYQVQASNALSNAKTLKKNAKSAVISSVLGGVLQGAGNAFTSGSLSGLFGGGGRGTGTSAALTSNLNAIDYNQAYS